MSDMKYMNHYFIIIFILVIMNYRVAKLFIIQFQMYNALKSHYNLIVKAVEIRAGKLARNLMDKIPEKVESICIQNPLLIQTLQV